MLSMNQMSAVARCVASSHAVRDLASGLKLRLSFFTAPSTAHVAGNSFSHTVVNISAIALACSPVMVASSSRRNYTGLRRRGTRELRAAGPLDQRRSRYSPTMRRFLVAAVSVLVVVREGGARGGAAAPLWEIHSWV